jgi:hypothetical protein
MGNLSRDVFERLIAPGPRLPWLADWLLGEVWTRERYAAMSPIDYLESGESQVNALEEIIASSAPRVYDELTVDPAPERDLRAFLMNQRPAAVVVFDGLSLREIPAVLKLAERSGLRVVETGLAFAATPSETMDFVAQRLRVGKGNIAPVQLPGRSDLREAGIVAFHYNAVSQMQMLPKDSPALLLWSAFPDQFFGDNTARFREHFQELHVLFETAWKSTVQQIPRGRKILVTSDHGYVFFGSNLSFARNNATVRPLTQLMGGERFYRLDLGDAPTHPDLTVLPHRGVAMIRGRVQTHPTGQASSKLYKHGGLSLMEMLTPWIVLQSAENVD